ncbi:MAG TPA: protein translocase subunit SecD [Gaiellaceae bacterium]|nr:protein translocase subunit SecD [Gaiellaceae bacterium]
MASRRSHLFLIALIVAALVGVGLLAVPSSPYHRSLREGLDLQGGLEVVLQAVPPKDHKLDASDMSRSISIMRNRVDKLGVSEPEIRQQGSNQIVIQLPAVHNQDQAASIIGKTAQLELYDLTPSLLPPSIDASENPVYETSLFDLLSRVQHSSVKGTPGPYYLFRTKGKKQLKGPSATRAILLKPTKGKVPKGDVVLSVPPKAVVVTCSAPTSAGCPYSTTGIATTPGVVYYYLFKHGTYPHDDSNPYPQMTGKDLKLTGTQQDFDPSSGQPIVTLQFTSHGNKQFHAITKAEAQRGSALGVEQSFAIVLDNQLYSTPTIDPSQFPDGIDPTAGGAEITGIPSLSEAKSLALVLQTGALPVVFNTIERTDISATLGKDSLKQARDAAIGGLIVVMLFLLLLYRFLGVVAVIGLGIYAAFMYAAILLFGVTLTLPGFAGLILTIGVAADANVVIFERIKEEGRGGKSMKAAIAAGYAKGFRTIVDANVVTCITALVLFGFATAEVKGFALMLLIGTVVSLVTAVAATRAMLGLLAGFRWFNHSGFMGAEASEIPRWQRIDVTGRRRLWFLISLAAIVLSIGALAVKGLNLGIDFKGGVQMTLVTKQPTSLSSVRTEATAAGQPDAVVQGEGKSTNAGNDYTSFQIRVRTLKPADQTKLENLLTSKVGAQVRSVTNVSASFSKQILKGAITSIIVSFILIALYVTLRYQWRFAIPILRTLLNDIPIALGVYSISGREVTASTVAAMLTILGYSVYDTIIVFDRVRENMRLMPRASIATIANISVAEVLKRSIVTSVITLLPIIALFIFGGATLQDFAFAIMVGITIGAVSTIFVATPLLTSLIERNPEYARRKGDVLLAGAAAGSGAAALREAERVAAAAPTPETPMDAIEEAIEGPPTDGAQDAKRERRKRRRQSRPHGRPR